VLDAAIATAPRRLRAANELASLQVTNIVGGCHAALRLLRDVESAFSTSVVAVLAPAGCGKTQLAAQLTAGTGERLHGVLLHGRALHADHTLDDLARQVSVAANPVLSMESLLAAVDAAGQRARQRLPVVIDGLNESEDPRLWKHLLAELETTLAKYPYVLLVCTLRPEFKTEALPTATRQLEIPDYGADTSEAIGKYFQYFKIAAGDAILPVGLLQHPLTLRFFCEVTNPTRQKVVGVDAMPGSLTALFDRYLDQVGLRIAELSHRNHRYYEQDVRTALALIGGAVWENRSRFLPADELRQLLGDSGRPWDQSLVRALEHEGVLLRMPFDGEDGYVPVYDRLGGHIVANALLSRYGQDAFVAWVRDPSTMSLLGDDHNQRHQLADDVVYSLVAQLPRRLHTGQLWQIIDEPLRSRALRFASILEPAYLDTPTVEALLDLVRHGDPDLLGKLREMRGVANHPLNADALHRVLLPMSVADRDLCWTEWLRQQTKWFRQDQNYLLTELERTEKSWKERDPQIGDRLRARWVMWLLTSSVRQLRDQATRALYWFGRSDPKGLFDLTIESLTINDSYVGERMLAASYGVVMTHQHADVEFGALLQPFLIQLANALIGESATTPTAHYLARTYVRGIVDFAHKFYGTSVPDSLRGNWSFAMPPAVTPIPKSDGRAAEVGRTLHMDFENYTLGHLFRDRSNYQSNHQGHQNAAAYVRGVVWSLGWREATFDALDREIAEDAYRHSGRGNRPPTERYGKKYGWIGFFTLASLLEAAGHSLGEIGRLSDVDIDPSFPELPGEDGAATVPREWLIPSVKSDRTWIRADNTKVPRALLVRDRIGEYSGPWVAVQGFVQAADRALGREVWAYLSALIIANQDAPKLVTALKTATEHPWDVREVPSDYYTFAGEIPWHSMFAAEALAYTDRQHIYRQTFREGRGTLEVELLAHNYAWESHHSTLNRAGGTRVPSRIFSEQFDLRSIPQSFDQVLPNGTRASITLKGVDGLEGDVLYLRQELLRQYVGDRTIVWLAFGRRELWPYPPSPPKWLESIERSHANEWRVVLTGADLLQKQAKKSAKRKGGTAVVGTGAGVTGKTKRARTTHAKKKPTRRKPPAHRRRRGAR
jgi:hypothetical protein